MTVVWVQTDSRLLRAWIDRSSHANISHLEVVKSPFDHLSFSDLVDPELGVFACDFFEMYCIYIR